MLTLTASGRPPPGRWNIGRPRGREAVAVHDVPVEIRGLALHRCDPPGVAGDTRELLLEARGSGLAATTSRAEFRETSAIPRSRASLGVEAAVRTVAVVYRAWCPPLGGVGGGLGPFGQDRGTAARLSPGGGNRQEVLVITPPDQGPLPGRDGCCRRSRRRAEIFEDGDDPAGRGQRSVEGGDGLCRPRGAANTESAAWKVVQLRG